MAGSIFKQAVKEATGYTWEEWVAALDRIVDPLWTHEQIMNQIHEHASVSDEWCEWIATMYEQLLGRIPVGVTKDAGVQIGIRKTLATTKEQAWNFLLSPEGLGMWIGDVSDFQLKVGYEYESQEGITGKITVVIPFEKLRMTWKRPEWDQPSRLQIYLLSTKSGKTTIAIHQEMLEDIYMREMMRRHWENILYKIEEERF